MKQLKQLLLVMAIALTGFTPAQAQTWTHYSEWMANTQKSYVYNNDYWRYDDGLMYESILDTYEHYKNGGSNIGDETLKNAVKTYIDKCIDSNGNLLEKYEDNTLDDIRPARMVYKYYKSYGGSNLLTACQTVMNCVAFSDNYRVINHSTGYPWQHKSSYAHQVWLDGIFMGLPYWTLAGPDGVASSHHSSWTANDYFNDAYNQMLITDEKTFEPEIGLWCHAWDEYFESTTNTPQYWSMKNGKFTTGTFKDYHTTYENTRHEGRSSHCWGRAAGWFAMAIMETMDNISAVDANYTHLTDLQTLFKKVIDAVWDKRDINTGMWRCVLDVDDSTGDYKTIKEATGRENYLEATCSAMFTYCLLHGVAKGYLPASYLDKAKSSYQGLINTFITTDGGLKLNNCMEVGGLGGTTKVNGTSYDRDGSFAYYTIEKKKANDSKGVGPFIWASLEAEKIGYQMATNSFDPIDENTIVTFAWSKASDEITQGTSYTSPTFTAKTYGNDTPLTNSSEIVFESSDPLVATVAVDGTVTPVGIGTATITAALKTGSTYTWSGTTPSYTITVNAPDTTAPTLEDSTPTNGATNIATSGNIVLTFSEDVACTTNATLTTTGSSAISLTPSVSGSTVTYSYSGLSNSTSYTFNLDANSVTDLAGNKYASAINIEFTTGAAPVNNTYSFGFNQDILDSYDSNGTLLSNPSHDGTVIDISSYGSSAALACGDAYVTSTSTKENCVSISNNASENYNQHYVEIHSTEDIKSIYLVAAVTGSTSASDAVAVGWTGTPSATISEYHTFTTPGKGDTSGKEISISFTTEGIKYVRLYRKIKLDSSTKTTFTSSSSTTIPSGGSTYGIAFIKVTTQTGSTPTPSKVATPVITGTTPFSSSTSVTMSCETTGATIHYTIDGSTPTSSSATYSEPINISATTTVKAIAVKEGMTNSEVASKTFTQDNTVPTVTMTTPSATTNVAITTSSVVLTVSEEVTAVGEDIAGTFNGSAITFTRTDATHLTYNLPDLTNSTTYNIQLNANQIQDAAGNKNAEKSFSFTTVAAEQEKVATPSISGNTSFTESTTATITCDTDGATIYYTTDGTTPTSNSTPYTTGINITTTTTIKAIAIKSGMTDSDVASATFTKSEGGGGTSATITYNLTTNTSSTTFNSCTSVSPTSGDIIASSTINKYGSADASSSNSAKADETQKLNIDNSYTANNYYEWTFTVGNGKNFSPSQVVMKFQAVSDLVQYKVDLTDGTTTYTTNFANTVSTAETLEQLTWNITPTAELTGTVRLKLWAYKKNNSASAFRLGSPITITGTVGDSSEPIIPTYTVTATSNNNSWGTVSVDKATAAEGATVTITTSPASGYELTSLAATDGESNDVTITNNQFTMPASNVTVNATFAAMEKVATPSITGTTPFTDNTTATITCATTGATIHYTIDGSTPTASSTTYSSPIAISATTTVKAIAIKSGMTDSEVASATFTKSGGGGGGSGTVLFSQNFNSATEVAYAADNTAQAITATSGNNIVGTNSKTQFSYIGMTAKSGAGIAINSTTGGNSVNATGFFQAYCNATGQNWALVHNTDFADTAPTALKIDMKIYFQQLSSGSDYSVSFAVGDNFENGTSSPTSANVHSGFSILNNSTAKLSQYLTKTVIYDTGITQGEWKDVTWIINNNGEELTYTDPKDESSTVNNDCFDLWIGTTKVATNQAATTSSIALQNLYIGDPAGKKNEFRLDEIVVTDLSPAAMRTTTATIKAGKQYATFNTTMDIDFDETDGLQAFVVDNATKSSIHLREVTVVPANTALIIKGAPDTYTLYETKKATESVSDNQLTISNSTVAADNKYYALGTVNGVQGFHRVQNGLTIPTSYVIITDQTAKSFLNFEEEENIATGIDGFATDNGFIVIDDNTPLYNLSGQRVSKSYKGIVIINGKKVLRK